MYALTCGFGGFGCAVRAPGRRLAPAHAGRHLDAQQVDGVRLQVLEQVLGRVPTVYRQLYHAHLFISSSAERQAVGRDTSTT